VRVVAKGLLGWKIVWPSRLRQDRCQHRVPLQVAANHLPEVERTAHLPLCQYMFTHNLVERLIASADCCPWDATCGRQREYRVLHPRQIARPLYTPDQRRRRDASHWTTVQGVLAPTQFAVFLVSLSLVLRYLATGDGLVLATASIVAKTLLLYSIMVTGSIWERAVFGRFLFAPAFLWEDVVSILVLALHTAYLVALLSGSVDAERQMWLALAAYASYLINATQFVLKLRAARRSERAWNALGTLEQSS
jgi:3-vinyl bacteriochlorophyllide hydratase